MNAYIYDADVYCEECAEKIRRRIRWEGHAPACEHDQTSYDSGEFPKGPFTDGGGESDCPQHCGNHEHCLNAITLSDGTKVGAFLENPLTTDGVRYVAEAIEESPSEVTELWADFYREELEQLERSQS
jgi:hypothetical protein